MIVEKKFFKGLSLTCHPTGCKAYVDEMIDYVKASPVNGKKINALIIGGATGYGLASRIALAFGCNANTVSVSYEREASKDKLGSTGFYYNGQFEKRAKESGLYVKSFNMDAFSTPAKEEIVKCLEKDSMKLDLIIYSIAAASRIDPQTGKLYQSVIKPINNSCSIMDFDFKTQKLYKRTIKPASETEIAETIKVMGGEDWLLWIKTLLDNNLVNENAITISYSYLGSKLTYPIYKDGTIGKAKHDLSIKQKVIENLLSSLNGRAYVCMNKALLTRASSVIPGLSLYLAALYKAMKNKNVHESAIEQMNRLFKMVFGIIITDTEGRIRMDDLEMRDDIQAEAEKILNNLDNDNFAAALDIEGLLDDLNKQNGFDYPHIDYSKDVDPTN